MSQLGEVPKFLLERKMTLKIAGGVKFSLLLCVGGGGGESFLYYILILQSLEFVMQDSHARLCSTKTSYHFYISDSSW